MKSVPARTTAQGSFSVRRIDRRIRSRVEHNHTIKGNTGIDIKRKFKVGEVTFV